MGAQEQCDHIVGFSEGIDEAWLTRDSDRDKSYVDLAFKFCPMCGAELEQRTV